MEQPQHVSAEPAYEVVWPLGKIVTQTVDLAPAILDLNDKTVCELWDGGFRGDEMYPVLNQELRRKYPRIRIVEHKTMGNPRGANEIEYVAKLADLLRQHGADAIISAVGA